MGVGDQRHDSAILPQGISRAPEPVWTGAENRAPTDIQSPDRPARNESLYRLRYSCQPHNVQ
jgi:hypothetical protein